MEANAATCLAACTRGCGRLQRAMADHACRRCRRVGYSIIVDRTFEAAAPRGRRFSRIQPEIDSAAPGDVCVWSSDHWDERVRVTRSGTQKASTRVLAVVSGPVLTAGFIIKVDHVSIEGFDVRNAESGNDEGRGAGIYIAGTGVKVIGNTAI
jgi:hypothetical protein